ncbi:MAG: glycoside hydrolase family 76 protein [Tannerellaceae bacterium]|nr:glycoside hydrolase family 76 protein [Tannerellaceae bacterium]
MRNTIIFLLFIVFSFTGCQPENPFKEKAQTAMETSLVWRDTNTGIWETAGWWNSANLLTALIRYSEVCETKEYVPVIEDIFEKSCKYEVEPDSTGNPRYCINYINDYYDDEGWWALAWIEAYKLTGTEKYLTMAETVFEDMLNGWDETCNGGIYWKKNPHIYKNAIANNLFSLTTVRLYWQTGNPLYKDWFERNVAWFIQSGMINMDIYQVEDGTDKECQPNRGAHYTYNQGVAIAVLAEMYLLTKEKEYLQLAEDIADATITGRLVTENGILREMSPDIEGSNDGVQFKGIFIRHLAFLYEVAGNVNYKDFIIKNASSIITNDYDPDTQSFGPYWAGPFAGPNAAANSGALECVIEAVNLSHF